MNFFKAIFSNILGYDILIIILGIINLGFMLPFLRKTIIELENHLRPVRYKSIDMLQKFFKLEKNGEILEIEKIEKLKEMQSFIYHAYTTMGTLFPLLGILGTILALISLKDFSAQIVTQSFSLALTSTFWGLFFAIVSRIFEGLYSPRVENNEKQIELLFNIDSIKKEG